MALNLKRLAEIVVRRMQLGWADGIDPQSAKDIPLLIKRIEELETGLIPFAKIAVTQKDQSNGKPLTSCYLSDCVNALALMDPNNSEQPKTEDFGLPAE